MSISKHVARNSSTLTLKGTSANNSGGPAYVISPWDRLDRFLVLGSEGGTYYQTEQKLTRENATNISALVKLDGKRVVNRIVEVSQAGRAPKNDPAIFALALCVADGSDETKKLALDSLAKVCRIGTHLYHFLEDLKNLNVGWGRSIRKGVASWFTAKPAEKLAYQLVKYQSRDGWSARDAIRLSHPRPATEAYKNLFQWSVKGWEGIGAEVPTDESGVKLIWAFEKAKRATTVDELLPLIRNYRLTHEMIPTQFKNDPRVWDAMLPHLGLTAVMRNLANMTRYGLLTQGSDAARFVGKQLGNPELVKQAKIHPFNALVALKTYQSGRSLKGDGVWTPVPKIVDALDELFYTSFGFVEPTGKKILLALDVSGSMGSPLLNSSVSCREGTAAMAMTTARVESDYQVVGFCNTLRELDVSPRRRLDDVLQSISGLPFGGTDIAQPFTWADSKGLDFDAVVVYTDNETNCGTNPMAALKKYRDKVGHAVKLVVVGMTVTEFSVNNPDDPHGLDVVGFDGGSVQAISDFISDGKVKSKEIVED